MYRHRLKARLAVEQLEDRRVLSVTFHRGAVLPHVEVEAEFYGDFWNSPAGLQQTSDINNYLAYLVDSSYMDMLNEYGVGRGTLSANGIVDPGQPSGSTVDDSALRQVLDSDLASGALLPPTVNRVYFVFTPPNVVVTYGSQNSLQDFYGYHDAFTDSAGQRVIYAVIANPASNGDFYNLTDFQTTTKVVSHELAEAATDPDSGGWFDNVTGDEIGDLANGRDDIGVLNGYVVQAEWSVKLGTSVLPAGATGGDAVSASQEIPNQAVFESAASAFTHSDEYFAQLIEKDYQDLLGRTASTAEVGNWVSAMHNGFTDEQVLATFAGSPEFYLHAGGTDQAFVSALYHALLGRAPDAAGQSGWLKALQSGLSRTEIAYGFAVSPEHESMVVAADYQRVLGRTPSSGEVASWVNAFESGVSNEQVLAGFAASGEFFRIEGGTIETWLTGVYHVLLGRDPDKAGFDGWDAYLESAFA